MDQKCQTKSVTADQAVSRITISSHNLFLIVFSDKIVDVLIVVNIGNVDVYKVEDGSLLILKNKTELC